MKDRDVEYGEEFTEYLQDLFPGHLVVSSVLRVTIEDDRLILPEAYVNFESAPARAERIISKELDDFLSARASEEGVKYKKTLKRIIVDDIESFNGLIDGFKDDWY